MKTDMILIILIVTFFATVVYFCLSSSDRYKIIKNQETIMAQLNTIQLNQSHMMPPDADRTWSTKKSIQDKIK